MITNSIHILSTKVLDEAIINQAASENIVIDCAAFIQIKPIETPGLKEKIEKAVEQNPYAIFTSTNAVDAVVKQKVQDLQLKIFCISGKTRKAVELNFPESTIVGDASYGAELVQKILNENIDSAVFFCGDRRLDTVPQALLVNSIRIEEIIVYETILTPQRIEKKHDGVMFFSPSAVESFLAKNRLKKTLPVFSFAGATHTKLKDISDTIIISKTSSEQGMFDTVKNYFYP